MAETLVEQLHFSKDELMARLAQTRKTLVSQGLDGILLFRQESMYYLTGYDTDGFVLFQTLFLGVDGQLSLVTRSADRVQAAYTSIIQDVRVWVDSGSQNPATDVKNMLDSHGMRGKKLGVEYDAYGLSAKRGKMLDKELTDFCQLSDASDLVRLQRIRKSPAELEYMREAGRICDAMRDEAIRLSVPGAFEGDIRGAMHAINWSRDGDPPAHVWPMGSGPSALLVRYKAGGRHISNSDQMFHEFGAAYRHYHAAMTLTVITGKPDPLHTEMFSVCRAALEACEEKLRAGNTVGQIFEAHRQAFIAGGFADSYLNVCGYTMGAIYPPTWMEDPLIREADPMVLEPNMVFFMHMLMVNRKRGLMMSLGEQAIVTNGACEIVTHAPRTLPVNS
jgi:Xaa-Pro dipeptidase